VLILESELGLSPWDVLNQGVAEHTPLSFGMANVVVGLLVLGLGWGLGGRPGVGTVANAILVGTFIQGLTAIDAVAKLADDGLSVRLPSTSAQISAPARATRSCSSVHGVRASASASFARRSR
jgi:uncharacterized protein